MQFQGDLHSAKQKYPRSRCWCKFTHQHNIALDKNIPLICPQNKIPLIVSTGTSELMERSPSSPSYLLHMQRVRELISLLTRNHWTRPTKTKHTSESLILICRSIHFSVRCGSVSQYQTDHKWLLNFPGWRMDRVFSRSSKLLLASNASTRMGSELSCW